MINNNSVEKRDHITEHKTESLGSVDHFAANAGDSYRDLCADDAHRHYGRSRGKRRARPALARCRRDTGRAEFLGAAALLRLSVVLASRQLGANSAERVWS